MNEQESINKMKVKDLIELLKKQNPEAEVLCEYDGGFSQGLYIWNEKGENGDELVITPQGYNRDYNYESYIYPDY